MEEYLYRDLKKDDVEATAEDIQGLLITKSNLFFILLPQ